jgi:ABC-2 type transport system permease protein
MVVFQYEWKRSKKSILIWAIVLAVCIFFMTPVYYGLIGMTDSLPENFAQGGFFETVGVSLDLLMKPLGMYSFLTGFFMIAGGILGMPSAITWMLSFSKSTKRLSLFTLARSFRICLLLSIGNGASNEKLS